MKTEFKEKTYEKFFHAEICRITRVSFSPDQCDEFFLGFDDAFGISPQAFVPSLRMHLGKRRLGVSLRDLRYLDFDAKYLPPFRFNLFVQYKRPDYLKSKGASEWPYWKAPYFRFGITPHQQQALENLERQSAGRAAVVYASPSFWSNDDLWDFVETGGVISNSNLAAASRLTGHDHYTYVQAGSHGMGHSEPAHIESPSLQATIERGMREEPLPLSQHLKRMAKNIEEAVSDSAFAKARLARARALTSVARSPRTSDLEEALGTIWAFSIAFEVSPVALG